MTGRDEPALVVRDLKVHFRQHKRLFGPAHPPVRAVDGVSFEIRHGETLGLVGESGCGKSTVGRAVAQLRPPTSGSIRFFGQDLPLSDRRRNRDFRRDLQIIFQDPYASLDPRMRVGAAVEEPLIIHGIASGREALKRAAALLELVGLPPSAAARYPHEFSGGQRQRIAIARALALGPKLIVCDEPISALDVSVQAQIINLLRDLQNERKLAFLFIAHDLAVVRHISHQVAVMYLGRIVERGPSEALCGKPLHPYTKALFAAAPRIDSSLDKRRSRIVEGEVPSPLAPPSGCHFHPRCPYVQNVCRTQAPPLAAAHSDRAVACHFAREIETGALPAKRDRLEPAA